MVNNASGLSLSHCGMQRLRVFGRICGPKRDVVTREWRRLHNEVFTDRHRTPKMFRVIKSRRMGWAGHVARTGDRVGACRVLVGYLQDLLVDETRIFKWMLAEQDRRV